MKTIFILILSLTSSLCFPQTDPENKEEMGNYLLHGKITAKAGFADQLTGILIEASELVATAKGHRLYIVSKDENEENSIFVTEIWDSKEDHDNSLKIEGVRELIMKAMPMIEGQPQKGRELKILGGTGL